MKSRTSYQFTLIMMIMTAIFAVAVAGCGGGGGGGGGAPIPPAPTTPSPTPTEITYTLTIDIQGQGTVSPPSGTVYENGDVATLTPTPGDNWLFARWEGPHAGDIVNNRIVMDSDKQVTAVFIRPVHDLTINITGDGTVARDLVASSRDEYNSGETVRLTASAGVGWVFRRWEGDLSSTANPETITMDNSKTITAVFEVATTYTLDTSWGINGEVAGPDISYPMGLVRTSSGALHVTNPTSNKVVTISSNGSSTTTWSWPPTNSRALIGVAISPGGFIFIADAQNDQVETFDAQDSHLGIFAGNGIEDPFGLCFDSDSNLYIGENTFAGNVKKYPFEGGDPDYTIDTGDGTGLSFVRGVFIDSLSVLYVCDYWNSRVLKYNPDNGGYIGEVDIYHTSYRYPGPAFMAEDSNGFLYITDADQSIIFKIAPDGTPYPITGGGLNHPNGIAADSLGNLYVADSENHRVVKLKPVD